MDGTATSEDFVADLRLQRERRQRERASRQQLLQQGASTNGTMPAASAATSSTDSFPSARRWEGDVMCAEQIDFLSAVLWVLHSSGCLSVRVPHGVGSCAPFVCSTKPPCPAALMSTTAQQLE